MVSSRAIGDECHASTKHSVLSVQIDPNYVDARTQPALFKAYPHFFRRFPLNLDDPIQRFISLTGAITDQKQYRDGTTHLLRVQPSAGALYPTELYVQLRGMGGLIDGIYHLEPERQVLTLIYELIDDGIEAYFPDARLIKGCIFWVSCVYFRSSWKYKNRSLRYCGLDSGHHLGAIEAAAYVAGLPYQLRFDFDQSALNDDFGLETQEFLMASVVVGEARSKTVRRLRSPLPIVAGTDYFEPNRFIEASYKQTLSLSDAESASPPLLQPTFPVAPAHWLRAIQQRRSARRFYPQPIDQATFQTVCTALQQPIPSDRLEPVDLYAVVQRVTGLPPGLYRLNGPGLNGSGLNGPEMHCLKTGEFPAHTGHLCLDQAIARDSAVVFFLVSDYQNYRVALQQSGLIGQRLYLTATALQIGCSGIGAFYDDETQAFLGTDRPVLYAVAIGSIKE